MRRCIFGLTAVVSGAVLAGSALAQQPRGPQPALVVIPLTSPVATGPQGGPFSPTSFQFRLRATTGEVNFSISTPSWVSASPSTGASDTSGVVVTLTINPTALSLPAGTY